VVTSSETRSFPVLPMGLQVSVTPAEHRDPAERARVDLYATAQFAVMLHRNGATALDDPEIVNTVSWFEHIDYRPLPRRWWHHLLFRTPVEPVTRPHRVDGFHEGAARYDLVYGLHSVVVPPELADHVRGIWSQSRPARIPPAIPYPRARPTTTNGA
jgi:hypothetical protein